MKKLTIICLVALLATSAGAATVGKAVDPEDANLGDHITVTLTVDNTYGVAIKVEDELPDDLKYIPGTFEVSGNPVTPTIEDNNMWTMIGPGPNTIEFEVQLVEVPAEEDEITNWARIYNPSATVDDSCSVDITRHPYDGFNKAIATSTEADPYNVPMHTDVHWLLRIEIENITSDEIASMENVVVKDNLGGDLEMHLTFIGGQYPGKVLPQPPSQAPTVDKKSGKTEKLHLSWSLADLGNGAITQLFLEISTDVNDGQGKKSVPKNEYTSDGPHDLNSGATLKFNDGDGSGDSTGFQLSAHTAPITVTAFAP
ncbi:MAG: hypothetical protein ACYS83_01205 [Planctomycetota bacterium]